MFKDPRITLVMLLCKHCCLTVSPMRSWGLFDVLLRSCYGGIGWLRLFSLSGKIGCVSAMCQTLWQVLERQAMVRIPASKCFMPSVEWDCYSEMRYCSGNKCWYGVNQFGGVWKWSIKSTLTWTLTAGFWVFSPPSFWHLQVWGVPKPILISSLLKS